MTASQSTARPRTRGVFTNGQRRGAGRNICQRLKKDFMLETMTLSFGSPGARYGRRCAVWAPVLSPLRIAGFRILNRVLASRNLAITSAGDEPARREFYERLRETRAKTNLVLRDGEAYSIYSGVLETAKIAGAIAEVGVFKGGSARLMACAKGDRELHLFDTFEGLPRVNREHDPDFREGTFRGTLEEVKAVLAGVSNVQFHKGLFPDSAAGLEHLRFSFVNVDVDLYESTRSCLEWFYPRMTPGGMLISHDFDADGVRKAFRDFFGDKPEVLIELTGSQVAFIRSGNSGGNGSGSSGR